jgi:hypothetical protein
MADAGSGDADAGLGVRQLKARLRDTQIKTLSLDARFDPAC